MLIAEREGKQTEENEIEEYLAQGQGNLPKELTHDPTQGKGTAAWQLSVKHSMQANARQRRN